MQSAFGNLQKTQGRKADLKSTQQKARTMKSPLPYAIAIAAAMTGGAVQAEGLYYGLSLSMTEGQSTVPGVPAETNGTYGALGVTAGYQWDLPNGFVAAELNYDVTNGPNLFDTGNSDLCIDRPSAPFFCGHDNTVRLRGILGTDLGDLQAFASLGVAQMSGQAATSPGGRETGKNTGVTFGIGLQQPVKSGTLRYELIVDQFGNVKSSPAGRDRDFKAVSLRFTYLIGK